MLQSIAAMWVIEASAGSWKMVFGNRLQCGVGWRIKARGRQGERKLPGCSIVYRERLTFAGGVNRYDEPNFRIIWGQGGEDGCSSPHRGIATARRASLRNCIGRSRAICIQFSFAGYTLPQTGYVGGRWEPTAPPAVVPVTFGSLTPPNPPAPAVK
jgi:hypothetical protein